MGFAAAHGWSRWGVQRGDSWACRPDGATRWLGFVDCRIRTMLWSLVGRGVVGAPEKRVTILDVARLAGVSRQTVTRAMNGTGRVNVETQQRVLDIARSVGYRPNRYARGMVGHDVTTVGLVVADLVNPYVPEVTSGLLEAANARGWQVLLYDTKASLYREVTAVQILARQADVVVGYFSIPEEVVTEHAGGTPVVLLEPPYEPSQLAAVMTDIDAGVASAVDYLVESGHRRIGMLGSLSGGTAVSTKDHVVPPNPRRTAFLRATRRRRLPIDESWVYGCPHTPDGGTQAMHALLDDHPDVTAVFAFNDLVAIGALQAVRSRGLQIPADCAVLGFDGLAIGRFVEPPLSTIDIDKQRIADCAIELVAGILAGHDALPVHLDRITPKLLLRKSA